MTDPVLHRVKINDLLDSTLTPSQLSSKVEGFANKTVSDGIVVDYDGNVLLSDVEHSTVYRIRTDRKEVTKCSGVNLRGVMLTKLLLLYVSRMLLMSSRRTRVWFTGEMGFRWETQPIEMSISHARPWTVLLWEPTNKSKVEHHIAFSSSDSLEINKNSRCQMFANKNTH